MSASVPSLLLSSAGAGLLAGAASCAAVQGGLLTSLLTRRQAAALANTAPQRGLAGHHGTAPPMAPLTVPSPGSGLVTGLVTDLVPTAAFLAGKLVSHTVFGAVLGLIGGAFLPSSGVLGGVQVVAGLLIVGLALAQLEAPGFRRVVITPPAAWARLVRGRARDTGTAAPALLGLATLLLPCMITLSMELLAATSGSATAGAAIMAGFVLGTAPLFMVFGMVASRAAVAVRKRLAIALGVVVLGAGLYSVNDGLMMAGSPVTAQAVWRSVTGHGGDRDAM